MISNKELGGRPQGFEEKTLNPEIVSGWPKDKFYDTWWCALSERWDEREFLDAANIRKEQGFSGIQLVVGVPPEIGPRHSSAKSDAGFPYDLLGNINQEYLDLAKKRIDKLNKIGLKTIIYGAWGHQIAWFGEEWMKEWWSNVVDKTQDTDSIYCLTGESNFLIGREKIYLPDKSSDDIFAFMPDSVRSPIMRKAAHNRFLNKLLSPAGFENGRKKRKNGWSSVLEHLSSITKKPIIIHVNAGELSEDAVNNPHLLSAVTTQIGQNPASERYWKTPIKMQELYPDKPFADLEHSYEGIANSFFGDPQIDAYWLSRIAGAESFFYGAHGMWQLGDGKFMRHWGKQSWQEALSLKTPQLLTKSHKVWEHCKNRMNGGQVFFETKNGELISIGRRDNSGNETCYYSKGKSIHQKNGEFYYLPLRGEFNEKPLKEEPVVSINFA
ncbi:MAG: DUF4038 domain-containing protein [Candidatus Levybacteria bacterium]|nr:DUF4038 domain-containing protein [Candidatus Levybacteria bacterium]